MQFLRTDVEEGQCAMNHMKIRNANGVMSL